MIRRWTILWDPRTEKELADIGRAGADRIREAVLSKLSSNPYAGKRLAVSSKAPLWRLRVGSYRVLYSIEPRKVVVLVLRVGHRSRVYRGLEKVADRATDP